MTQHRYTFEHAGQRYTIEGPAGMTEDELLQAVGAEDGGAGWDEGLSYNLEMASNIPTSAWSLLKGIGYMLANPIDTAQALGGVAQGGAMKGGRKVAEWLQGKDFPKSEEEIPFERMWDSLVARYGSKEAVERTLREDPVGVMMDLQGGITATGRRAAMGSAGALMDPVRAVTAPGRAAGTAASKVAGGMIPESLPRSMYESSLKPSTVLKPDDRAAIVDTAVRGGYLPNDKGLQQLYKRAGELSDEIDTLIREATEAGEMIPARKLFQLLDESRRSVGGVRVDADKNLSIMDNIAINLYYKIQQEAPGGMLTPKQVQTFKTDAYDKINWDAGKADPKNILLKDFARAGKEAIEEVVPDIRGVNREWGDLANLEPHLRRGAGRIGNRAGIGLMDTQMPIAGASIDSAIGIPGATTGLMTGLRAATRPMPYARMALVLEKIRKGDRKWLKDPNNWQDARAVMYLLSQNLEAQGEN